MPNIKIQTTVELSVPKGTKVISNDEFITLSRKQPNNTFTLFTCPTDEINIHDLHDEGIWMSFTKQELETILGKK